MWGWKRRRTVRSSIRMCWYHMFSETSPGIFVLRTRETPSCDSTWVKMEFHVHHEEPETAILTVVSSVFDGCTTKFMYVSSRMCVKTWLVTFSNTKNLLDFEIVWLRNSCFLLFIHSPNFLQLYSSSIPPSSFISGTLFPNKDPW